MTEYSEERYLEHLRAVMPDVTDPVGTYAEWGRFKRALARWVEEEDLEYDRAAVEFEHGDD